MHHAPCRDGERPRVIRSHHTGALTLLDVTTEIPAADADFESVDAGGVRVRFSGGPSGRPHKLVIELRRRLRRHPVAYWDGCAFKP